MLTFYLFLAAARLSMYENAECEELLITKTGVKVAETMWELKF